MLPFTTLLSTHGAWLLFGASFAERLGVPLPAAPLLLLAGGLAAEGRLSLAAAFAACVVASIAGDGVWYLAGRRHGHRVLGLLCRISLSPDSCVRQSENLIVRWGGVALVGAKFLPGVSVVAAPMSGALGMGWRRFLGYEALGSAAWATVYLGIGLLFAAQVQALIAAMAQAGSTALAVAGAALAAFVAQRWWRRRRAARAADLPRIEVAELRRLIAAGHAPVVIDVRSRGATTLDERRFPGAREVALAEIAQAAATLPRDREIVLVCNCPNEVSAAHAARQLIALGFARARPLRGGLEAWLALPS